MIHRNWQELIKPTKLDVDIDQVPKGLWLLRTAGARLWPDIWVTRCAAFFFQALQGAAVTAVQIDGVLHEFSSIPGVREDVTDIILNIKELAIRMDGEGPKRMVVRKEGAGQVTAGDIQTVGDIEILNPELVLCTLG